MSRLTKDQWLVVKNKWEVDQREGFDWLVAELNLDVSRQAVSKAAKAQSWCKVGLSTKVADKVAQLNKSCATKAKQEVAQLKSKEKSISVLVADEGVESGDRLHGNSLYKYEYDEQARKLCLLSATDAELADFFGVSESTINLWKLSHESFSESIRKGKIMADANISDRLYQRAMGYSHDEEKIFNNQGEALRVETIKHYPPDTSAIRLWLLNRRPKDWRANVEAPVDINLNVFPAKEVLDAIYEKALAQAAERDKMLIGRRERLGIIIDNN